MVLVDCHNNDTGKCFPGIKYIAAKAGLSHPSAKRSIAWLAENGFLTIEHRYDEQQALTSSQYHLQIEGGVTQTLPNITQTLPLGSDRSEGRITQIYKPVTITSNKEPEKEEELAIARSSSKEKSKWLEILEQDSRWPREDNLAWMEDVESGFIAPRALDLAHGRTKLAVIAWGAYEWLQTDKGKKKTPRGMKLFWHNWLKKEEETNATFEQPNMGKYPGRDSKQTEQERIREKRRADNEDLYRRLEEIARDKAERQRNAGGTG
jgi:hypothetical protein